MWIQSSTALYGKASWHTNRLIDHNLAGPFFVVRTIGIGGADGIRTHYLLTASQTLSQLSYSPAWLKNITKQLGKLKLRLSR